MMAAKTSIADDLVFPSQAGTVLKPDNIAPRYMEPSRDFPLRNRPTAGSAQLLGNAKPALARVGVASR